MDIKILVALISAAVSLVTVLLSFLLKAWFERHFIIFKLESEYEYEQKKKTKEIIAKNKTTLLDAAESLNYRLWNFSENYVNNWHYTEDISTIPKQYYLSSFSYRILSFFALVHKTEKEMIYLDTTVASPTDLYFLKFLKFFTQVMCDDTLYNGLGYDSNVASDHFFRNHLVQMCECFWDKEKLMTFSDYKSDHQDCLQKTIHMPKFINGINPNEDRLRWDRLQSLHFVLIMFLNAFGYDFLYTDSYKIKSLLAKSPRPNKTFSNLTDMMQRMKLDQQKEVKKILPMLKGL